MGTRDAVSNRCWAVAFLALYLLSALGGSVLGSLLAPTTGRRRLRRGVGVLGAMFVIGRHLGANVTAIAVLLGINLVITFLPGSGIAWQAHIGGGLVGALIGVIFARTRKIRQRALQVWLLVAVGRVCWACSRCRLFIYA